MEQPRRRSRTVARPRSDLVRVGRHTVARLRVARARGQREARRAGRIVSRLVRSKPIRKAAFLSFLAIIVAASLYIPVVLLYLKYYYQFRPTKLITVPIHLQYGVGPHPFGIAALDNVQANLHYDITVTLTLPRSPPNLERGNFMVALHLLAPESPSYLSSSAAAPNPLPYLPPAPTLPTDGDGDTTNTRSPPAADPASNPNLHSHAHFQTSHTALTSLSHTRLNLPLYLSTHRVLHTSTRAAILPYTDPLAARVTRLFLLPYYILFPRRATTTRLTLPMTSHRGGAVRVVSSGEQPRSLLLEVQGGQGLQVYGVEVRMVAGLRGVRWVVYRWPVVSFVVVTGVGWGVMVGGVVGMGLVVVRVLGGRFGRKKGKGKGKVKGVVVKREGHEVVEEKEEREAFDDAWEEEREAFDDAWEEAIEEEEEEGGDLASSHDPVGGGRMRRSKGKGVVRNVGAEEEEDEEAVAEKEEERDLSLFRIPRFDVGAELRTASDEERQDSAREEPKGKGKAVASPEAEAEPEDLGIGTSYSAQEGQDRPRRRHVSILEPTE